jgi:hypothetical protein
MLSTTDRVSLASARNDLDLRALTAPGLGTLHLSRFRPDADGGNQ